VNAHVYGILDFAFLKAPQFRQAYGIATSKSQKFKNVRPIIEVIENLKGYLLTNPQLFQDPTPELNEKPGLENDKSQMTKEKAENHPPFQNPEKCLQFEAKIEIPTETLKPQENDQH